MKTVLDTTEFAEWCQCKHGIDNEEWHEKILCVISLWMQIAQ